jgi:hypothetical protein
MNLMELHAILFMLSTMHPKPPSYFYLSLSKSCPNYISGKLSNTQIFGDKFILARPLAYPTQTSHHTL